MIADLLGLPFETVFVTMGDTDIVLPAAAPIPAVHTPRQHGDRACLGGPDGEGRSVWLRI